MFGFKKRGHQVKSKENLVNSLEITFLGSHHVSCKKCLDAFKVNFETGSFAFKNWVTGPNQKHKNQN